MRRNRTLLQRKISEAKTDTERAIAHYNLGVFHDNNSRETEAIPHYREAIWLGLDAKTKAECVAWLSSSLYKTGNPEEALERLRESMALTKDAGLKVFLEELEKRIKRTLA
jgi:tetratricopeptide (TPR) repeat protein